MLIHMDKVLYVLVNWPVVSTSLLTTVFFSSCLLVSKSGQEDGVKQPLLMLLWSVVACNGCVQLTILLCASVEFSEMYSDVRYWLARSFLMRSSTLCTLSATAWLSLFYFSQIVPAHRPFFMWTKRNIKKIVYWGLAVDRGFIAFGVIIKLSLHSAIIEMGELTDTEHVGFTLAPLNATEFFEAHGPLLWASLAFFYGQMLVLTLHTLGVMLSCGATATYLWEHMKRMRECPGGSVSSPRLHNQCRATVTGIVQGGLYVFCSLSIIVSDLVNWFGSDFDQEYRILTTVVCLFSFGTGVNLGFGQALFRQRLTSLWHRALQVTQTCGLNRA